MTKTSSLGFTLIELLVVVTIIGLLSGIGISSFASSIQRTRDTQRISNLKEIETALKRYFLDNGKFPPVTANAGSPGGWEVSFLGPFIESLDPYFENGTPVDPLNTVANPIDMFFTPRPDDGSFFYMYYNYPTSLRYGCDFDGPFSIIGLRALENGNPSSLPQAFCDNRTTPSFDTCPRGGILNECRYWAKEFDYSLMLRK
ncbi:type II secretion system protein [bacterium]|uniref:Type II secretion system protein GspG C-terminal domain-containing protein n=2 Tax=Katanobacteria TaxID=422282 RepID=A0A2M7X0M3_UNCKA|nr:type II secretion system protein [bacterium]PIP57012.1 MAG: hypothetical protein COX05_00195 [candidate division WWE3 bacterium CG22_combo_CG10-13_8_21_14_all_39_12]PJA39695.1 MAG: hypothetical protein CO179_04710 [candidate division WWE3 bacterium CG_4_9_14_3_um_filter_39_7]